MPVEWTDDPAAFASPSWDALIEADPDATVFHTPRYQKLYWEELGSKALRVAFVRQGGEPVAASAFEVREGVLSFVGGFDVTDYMGPVGLPAARDAAAKELVAALAARAEWERADLRGLPRDGRWLGSLTAAAAAVGLARAVEDDGLAPFLGLPATFDRYLTRLPSKSRHELRRKRRRLLETHPDVRLVEADRDGTGDDIGAFIEMHRASEGPKGRFMDPRMERFFRRLADALLPDGTLRLVFLVAAGERIAAAVGFRDGRVFRLYNSAYDRSHAAVAPGIVLVTELIRELIGEGAEALDFLKGSLRYKYRFGARPRPIGGLTLSRT